MKNAVVRARMSPTQGERRPSSRRVRPRAATSGAPARRQGPLAEGQSRVTEELMMRDAHHCGCGGHASHLMRCPASKPLHAQTQPASEGPFAGC
jgi:hypothetical protein